VAYPTFTSAIALWVGFGVSSLVMNYPAHIKIVRSLADDKHQGKIFGFNETFVGLANIVFGAIQMFVFTYFAGGLLGIKASIIVVSLLSLIFAVLVWFVIDNPDENKEKAEEKAPKESLPKMTGADYLNIVKSPATWLIGLSIYAMYSAIATLSYFTPYFTEVLGVTVTFSGALAILRLYGMSLIGAPLGGFLTDRVQSASKVLLVVNITIVILLLILMNLGASTSVGTLIVLTLAISLAVYIGRGSYYAVISEMNVPKRYTASTIGIAAALGFSPDLFQFVLFGHWIDKYQAEGYNNMFIYQIVICGLGALTALVVLKIKNKKQKTRSKGIERRVEQRTEQ